MFLALRELRHSRLRYGLIGAILALVAWLVFLLSGLANGLATDNGSAIQHLNADYVVFQSGARTLLHRSILPMQTVQAVKQVSGVQDAAPLGQFTITVQRVGSSEQIDATVLAIDPTSFLAPPIITGTGLDSANQNGVVLDRTAQRHGVKLGDTLKVMPAGQEMTVVGFTEGQTYSHLPVIYMDIPLWQSLRFAAPGSAGAITDPISAVAVKMDSAAAARVAADVPGVEVATKDSTLQNLPGYKEETGSVNMIQAFLFIIAAFIMAAFFYVLTLQKSNQFGVLKALGASTRFLARDLVGQVLLMTIVGVIVGALLSYAVAAIIPAAVPFALSTGLVVVYGGVLLLVALAGTLLSLFQIARVDALVAIGRVD
ncbi:MAG: Heme efflux system permease HrtB [Ktedonobacterales bacterium]|jgi:putative ABC transport system permease protein|nr:MAG: Heme efflux system permease HrtB [Ktedonobacterales bacterium]